MDRNSPLQQLAVEESAAIHDRSRILLSEVDKKGGLAILENPATSMTWDDPLMVQWVHTVAPFAAQASACQFGRDWAKAWMFVANRPDILAVAKSCPHAASAHQQIADVRTLMALFSVASRVNTRQIWLMRWLRSLRFHGVAPGHLMRFHSCSNGQTSLLGLKTMGGLPVRHLTCCGRLMTNWRHFAPLGSDG